jgi:hypothetical protein
VISDDADRFHLILSSGKHHGDVNLIPVLDLFGKFVGIGALKVHIDFNDVRELSILAEEGGFHSRIFFHHVLEAFSDSHSLHVYDFLTVRELPERKMKMDFDSHFSFLLVPL